MNEWLMIGTWISVNSSLTSNWPWVGSVGPPWPARSPVENSTSVANFSDSLRYSPPTLMPTPRSDQGVCKPYSPPSNVKFASATVSLTLPRWKPGVDRYASAAGVTELDVKTFHGTQFGSVPFRTERQTGVPTGTPATPPVAAFASTW